MRFLGWVFGLGMFLPSSIWLQNLILIVWEINNEIIFGIFWQKCSLTSNPKFLTCHDIAWPIFNFLTHIHPDRSYLFFIFYYKIWQKFSLFWLPWHCRHHDFIRFDTEQFLFDNRKFIGAVLFEARPICGNAPFTECPRRGGTGTRWGHHRLSLSKNLCSPRGAGQFLNFYQVQRTTA